MKVLVALVVLVLAMGGLAVAQEPISVLLKIHTADDPDVANGDSLFVHIQVATDLEFQGIVIDSDWMPCENDADMTYEITIPHVEATYWWRVRYRDRFECITEWQCSYYFIVSANNPPTGGECISPEDGAVIGTSYL